MQFPKTPIAICVFLLVSAAALSTEAADCKDWNTKDFFKIATLDDVTRCLGAGADPNARLENRYTPLHEAVRHSENPAVIAALLDAGANPNARGTDGSSALHKAATLNDNPSVITALLDAGADPNVRQSLGRSPLHLAARHTDNFEVISVLLAGGADARALASNGSTALNEANLNQDHSIRRHEVYWLLNDAHWRVYDQRILGTPMR